MPKLPTRIRCVGMLALVTTLLVVFPASSLAADAPHWDPPTTRVPPTCTFVFAHFSSVQSWPETGIQPCYRTPSTTLLSNNNNVYTNQFASPIKLSPSVRVENGRATGSATIALPGIGTHVFYGARYYVPGQLATLQWSSQGIAINASTLFTGGVDTTPHSGGGFTAHFTSENTVQLDFDLAANIFDRETYIFFSGNDSTMYPNRTVDVVLRIPKLVDAVPTASCLAIQGSSPGAYRMVSTSTDPSGMEPAIGWAFDDGGSDSGPSAPHTFTTPGYHKVTMTVMGSDTTVTKDCIVNVPRAKLAVSIDYDDGNALPPFDPDEDIPVTVTVKAVPPTEADTAAMGPVTDITFNPSATPTGPAVGPMLRRTAGSLTFTAGGVTPSPTPAFALELGESKALHTTIRTSDIGTYTLASTVGGTVVGKSGTYQTVNYSVGGSTTSPGEIGSALDVDIDVDPASGETQDELSTEDEAVAQDLNVTVTVTNNSGATMSSVVLDYLKATSASKTASAVDVFNTKNTLAPYPGYVTENKPLIQSPATLADGASVQYHILYKLTDDVDAQFSAFVEGTREGEASTTDTGSARKRWKAHPKYLLSVKTQLVNPARLVDMLPAGEAVQIKGTVENLSATDTLTVGPMYPELGGNAGYMSMTWTAAGADPNDQDAPTDTVIQLKPREKRSFNVRFLTGYSDPTKNDPNDHSNHSGGTRASVKFTPWGRITDDDGVTRDVEADEIKEQGPGALEHPLQFDVPVDDSITIPELEPFAYAGAIMYGGAEGAKNAVAAVALAPADLLILSYTSLRAIAQFQQVVWNEFTEAEKDRFSRNVALLAVEVLKRNAIYAKMAPAALYNMAYEAVGRKMTQQANAWAVGDWTEVVEAYSAGATDAIGQVVLPIAWTKLTRSAETVAVVRRAQQKLQDTFERTIGFKLASLQKLQEVGPLLQDMKNGTELLPHQIEQLYGISPDELTELQRLATKYEFLLTVRSRHGSSLKWIEQYGAMLKPEALKIKSVSDLDTKLGYSVDDVGSLVFRKPTPLADFEAAGSTGNLEAYVDGYLARPEIATKLSDIERIAAKKRLFQRIDEWKEYSKKYKQWSKVSDGNTGTGYLDVSFNWVGNGISDTTRAGTGKYVGFRMQRLSGEGEAYRLLLQDPKTGRFVPVTGDIDPIAFTHLDGSPLSMDEHASLMDDMIKSPLLRAQHPESTTFVGKTDDLGVPLGNHNGVGFIAKQFKRYDDGTLEPGLQIAPGGLTPRVVRLNEKDSKWFSPFDYNVDWIGGFVYAGSRKPAAVADRPLDWAELQLEAYIEGLKPRPKKLAPSTSSNPTVGTCTVSYSNAPSAQPLVLTGDGKIARVTGGTNGTSAGIAVDDALTSACFSDGSKDPVQTMLNLSVSPATQVIRNASAGTYEIEVEKDAGSAAEGGEQGFNVGQQIVIGAGTDHAESGEITGFGSIILRTPLKYAHEAGEAIVVVAQPPPPVVQPPKVKPHLRVGAKFRPRLAGIAKAGRTLSCTTGVWLGTRPITFTYAWQRKVRARWVVLRRQTHRTYRIPSTLIGRQLRCVVTARNAAGRAVAYTAASRKIVRR